MQLRPTVNPRRKPRLDKPKEKKTKVFSIEDIRNVILGRMPMNKIKTVIRDFERTKGPFQKLVVLGSIQNELEIPKKNYQ